MACDLSIHVRLAGFWTFKGDGVEIEEDRNRFQE
jgi:hypothetical protein